MAETLSHYRITAAIGAGGMGEVYRSTDTRLGREVALKLLPKAFAADPERLARFPSAKPGFSLRSITRTSPSSTASRRRAWMTGPWSTSSRWSWWKARTLPSA